MGGEDTLLVEGKGWGGFFSPSTKKFRAVQIICLSPCADNLTALLKALVSLKYAHPIRILIFVQRPGA